MASAALNVKAPKSFKPPKTLGATVDLLYTTRLARLAKGK